MKIEQRLTELGLVLPPPLKALPGLSIPFAWVRVRGKRAFVSGHGAHAPDGGLAGPFGKVPTEVSLEDAQRSARDAALAILGSLQRALGDLDRVTAWLTVSGMVNAEPGFAKTTAVMNGFSELLLSVYGPEAGQHARTAIGVAALAQNLPVIVSAEVEIDHG